MPPVLVEWLSMLARWIHVVAGIMWIGDSLLFMWIDSHLAPDPERRPDVTGVTWLLHSGGYYHLEQRRLIPGRLPPSLRWFWLEATSTWLSGFLLLILVYYLSADAFMVDRGVSGLGPGPAVALGIGMLVGGWLIYDGVWRSSLTRRPLVALAVSGALLVGIVYAATHALSARAAFIHIGAMLGTLMAANVWVHILRPQREMVRAAAAGRPVDPALGIHAKTRSTHNTYLTFPVIFLMLSQHFPLFYAGPLSWVVVSLFIVGGATARHVMMAGVRAALGAALATAAVGLVLVYLTARPAFSPPPAVTTSATPAVAAPPFPQVRAIVAQRCAVCHSETPSMSWVAAPPNSAKMDTPRQIKALAALIKVRAVDGRMMPPGNVTKITDSERATLGRWIDAGAPLR